MEARQRQRQRQPSAQPADAPHGLAWRARDADGVGAQVVLLRHSYYRRHTPKDEGVGVLEEDEPLDPCPHRICHQSLPTPVALQNTRGQGTQTSRRPCIHTPMLVQQCVHIAVAMRLGFWNWEGGNIPLQNYIGWAILSFLIFLQPFLSSFQRRNRVAAVAFLIQALFFLLQNVF